MTIVCNSAYIQTEILNFTFARQAIIVYFDAERWVLMYEGRSISSRTAAIKLRQ